MALATLLNTVGPKLWQSYNRSLTTSPVLTKSFTSLTGFIIGDSIAQIASKPIDQFDLKRTARFAAFGFCIHAPGCHYFYRALDTLVFPAASKSVKAIVAKTMVDQLMFTPLSICVFYSIFKTMEGQASKIQQTIKEKFWPTLLAGWTVWPLAHIINFRFVGTNHRVLYINVVQIGWNVLFCKIATSGEDGQQSKLKKSDTASDLHQLEAGLADDAKSTSIRELSTLRR